MSQFPVEPQSGGQGPNNPPHEGSSGMAIAALVCGILGFCFAPLGIVALILGIIFLSKTRDGRPGRGMAMAGTILGGVGLVVSIFALLLAILLPALGAARRTARRMQNSTQIRAIHQGLVMYSNSNNNKFPGIASNGDIWADGAMTGNSGDGSTPQARFWILLDGAFVTPEYLISPSETDPITPYLASGPVTEYNYSYAQLSFGPVGPTTAGRAGEWAQTINSQAIILSDRNTGSNGTTDVNSIHSDRPGNWSGSILWNDNHVAFENSHLIFQTKYANGPTVNNDNLFEDDGTGGYDALMQWD